ncbi:hypothetical protein H5410_055680 [Solanum commersonii]|uniref:Protein FAR1-RELATED SEQUENCE n=1 Tax=Solanum commersonii TaxID=4109 RepID=A0A9J5WJ12_SOLCO|nr:hypothetical protein H5410_055680 [Solanum commersonii]
MISEDSLMNENEWVDDYSLYRLKNDVHLDEDGEIDREYDEERDLVAHDRFGIRPSKNIRLAEVQRGGPQNFDCTPKDCRNFILKSKNREFFYSIDVDSSRRLRNMICVHSHCEAVYEHFHDAICFDTTYLVNRYIMSCASIVGSKYQRQSILLGCTLISHEDICPSIKPTIEEVMPHIVHRYCIWHLFSKLSLYFSEFSDTKIAYGEFKSMILDSISVENFEIR